MKPTSEHCQEHSCGGWPLHLLGQAASPGRHQTVTKSCAWRRTDWPGCCCVYPVSRCWRCCSCCTGMNIYAAAFLLPVGVMFYTAQGGLKASYVASWANTGVFLWGGGGVPGGAGFSGCWGWGAMGCCFFLLVPSSPRLGVGSSLLGLQPCSLIPCSPSFYLPNHQ